MKAEDGTGGDNVSHGKDSETTRRRQQDTSKKSAQKQQ